jgi:hypothetical protein
MAAAGVVRETKHGMRTVGMLILNNNKIMSIKLRSNKKRKAQIIEFSCSAHEGPRSRGLGGHAELLNIFDVLQNAR